MAVVAASAPGARASRCANMMRMTNRLMQENAELPADTQSFRLAMLDLLTDADLIFHVRCGVYLRALGKPISAEWLDWIG